MRDEPSPNDHSPCIINLDDTIGQGTHWVCCVKKNKNTLFYFDSFGMHYPKEYKSHGKKNRI